MKTQAILIAAIALLLGTDAGLVKLPPESKAELTKPAPDVGGGAPGELTKPAPGPGKNDLTKPAPQPEIKPLPGTGGDLIKPLPGTPPTRNVLPHLVLSPELASVIKTAENGIASAISKQGKQIQKVPEQSELELDDLYIVLDNDITVKLSKVKLLNVPAIEVTSANPNLEFLNMALNVDFGTVHVGGSFEVVTKRTLAEVPIKSSGEFVLKNSGVKGNGKVGLSLQTNIFKTINYDVGYQQTGSYLTVSYLEGNKRIVSVLEIQEHQEAKIVAHINRELKGVFNRMVQKQLDDILAGLLIDRLMGRTLIAESYRQHAKALRAVANDYIDEVLRVAQTYIADNGLSVIEIPNIEASFSQEILWITWWGRFATSGGLAGNLDSLIRTGDVSVDYDTTTGGLKVYGSVGLSQLYLGYRHYEAQFQGLGPSGAVAAQIGSNSVFLKVDILLSTTPTIGLEDLHIEYARDFTIQIDGLGILDWLVSSITTWIVNLFDDEIVGAVDGLLGEYVAGILPLVDPTQFFG